MQWGPLWRLNARDESDPTKSGPDTAPPRGIYAKKNNALRLTALDARARARGLTVGLSLADARARVPDLDAVEEDLKADCLLLEAIADWCDRYTPLVALDPPDTHKPGRKESQKDAIRNSPKNGDPKDGLLLDITGCAHLFGGEAALLDDMLTRLKGQGFAARGAIAGTMSAASALARYGRADRNNPIIIPPGQEQAALASLPLAALRLDTDIVDALAQVGLRTIADLASRPRAPLAARFGLGLITRLDAALGDAVETLSPRQTPPALVAERRFAEAVVLQDTIFQVVLSLGASISETLSMRGEGARLLEVSLFRVDGTVTRTRIGTGRPLRDPALILRLFAERLKGTETEIDAGFGFDLIRLSVLHNTRDDPRQVDMSGHQEIDESVERLIDRLGARLGMENVTRYLPGDSHVPEIEAHLVPAALAKEAALAWPDLSSRQRQVPIDRPIRFFSPPEPIETLAEVPDGPPIRFRWRKVSYDVRLAEGPERIAPPWWQGNPSPTRDYFRVEDSQGRRFWIFREGLYESSRDHVPASSVDDVSSVDDASQTDDTEIHPTPAAAPSLPRWYMQGLFP